HPLDGLGVEAARRAVQRDAPEGLDAGVVLAHEPRAVGREGNVVLDHHGLHLPRHVELRHLVVVNGAAEDVGRAVVVEVDQALDRAHGRRWRREDAHLRGGLRRQARQRGEAGDPGGRGAEEVAARRAPGNGRTRLDRVAPGMAAAIREPPARERERLHGEPPRWTHANAGSMRTSSRYGPPLASPRPAAPPTSAAFSTRPPDTPGARAMPMKSMSGRARAIAT